MNLERSRSGSRKPYRRQTIRVEHCECASINGGAVPLSRLSTMLAGTVSDVVRLTLEGRGVVAAFGLDFRITSDSDLEGVEEEFTRTAQARRLDTRPIDEFIGAATPFGTAIGYCDGICAYLYGVLAKERMGGTSLPYEAYGRKFSKAVEELAAYERPQAPTIRTLGGISLQPLWGHSPVRDCQLAPRARSVSLPAVAHRGAIGTLPAGRPSADDRRGRDAGHGLGHRAHSAASEPHTVGPTANTGPTSSSSEVKWTDCVLAQRRIVSRRSGLPLPSHTSME
jgi:hypothetical protein